MRVTRLPPSAHVRAARRILMLLLVCCIAHVAVAAEEASSRSTPIDLSPITLSQCGLVQSSSKAKPLTAKFVQERSVAGLTRPLLSSGEFSLQPGKELVWETRKPLVSTVRVTKEGFEVKSSAGTETHQEPKFAELSTMLLSLHSLAAEDLAALQKKFTFECYQQPSASAHRFLLRAVPKGATVQRVLSEVEIQGSTAPAQITLKDARGDVTTIVFTTSPAK